MTVFEAKKKCFAFEDFMAWVASNETPILQFPPPMYTMY